VRARDGALLWQFGDATNGISSARFSPKSDELVTGGPDPGFTIWSVPEFRRLATLGDATAADRRFRFAPDGRQTNVLIWDYPERRLLRALESNVGRVFGASFSDGSRVYSERTEDLPGRQQQVWNWETGESIARFPSEPMRYTASVMAGDAEHYVTVSTNRVAAVWKLGDPEPIFETAAESRQFWKAAISVKHQRLATLSHPNRLRFWVSKERLVSFDFISENDTIVPFLIAVTLE
jgi:WD40 repeat protein